MLSNYPLKGLTTFRSAVSVECPTRVQSADQTRWNFLSTSRESAMTNCQSLQYLGDVFNFVLVCGWLCPTDLGLQPRPGFSANEKHAERKHVRECLDFQTPSEIFPLLLLLAHSARLRFVTKSAPHKSTINNNNNNNNNLVIYQLCAHVK